MSSLKTDSRWSKPELLVLARSKPEETVLESCKTVNYAGAHSPGTEFNICASKPQNDCVRCYSQPAS